MFNKYSTEDPFPPLSKPTIKQPYYLTSKTAVDKMASSIMQEERQLITQGLLPDCREEGEVQKAVISLDDDEAETTHGLEEEIEDFKEQHQSERETADKDSAECVEIPTINLQNPQGNGPQAVDESMANYKINRQKYHWFCENQALKEEEARKQRKDRKVQSRKAEEEQDRGRGKTKIWKAEATSTKRILSTSNATERSPNPPTEAMTMIDKLTIPSMYQLTPAQAVCVGFVGGSEDPFFLAVYESVKADMQYARIYKLRESNLSKIRTFIVRRILDDFVAQRHQDSPQQREHLARHNRRITRLDRNRYLEAGISEPPSRMKSHYLQQIFQNQPFADYFAAYLASQRLRLYMEASNQEIADRFWRDVLAIGRREGLSLEERTALFRQIKRKPLFHSQIAEYLEEANMIRIEYCKERPAQQ